MRVTGSDRVEGAQAAATVIARETRVEGQITGKRSVKVEGVLKGGISLEAPLEVVQGAHVEGDVSATVVRIGGNVVGNVKATELVELQAGAAVKGDVAAPAIHIVEGAHLDGRVQMTKEKPAVQPGPVQQKT